MKTGSVFTAIVVAVLFFFSFSHAGESAFEKKDITGRISFMSIEGGGEDQLFITSEKGIVIFNTFWSTINARIYREAITEALGRDDFAYVINMVDRLDMFGGNAAYEGSTIIGHRTFLDKFEGNEGKVEAEIARLIEMWRWKEKVSRERLPSHEPGSKSEKNEIRWMNTCAQRARELEEGFSLVLPDRTYDDRMSLDLGDLTLELISFGRAGYDGMTVAVVPEEKAAIIPGFIMHSQHLAPHPMGRYADLDVERWIAVFEEILEGEGAVETVICDINQVWSVERARSHLNYIRTLWEKVSAAEAAGEELGDIQEKLSLEGEFAFVKEMQAYIDGGDAWIRPQHRTHVRLFFLQHKNLASELIREEGTDSALETAGKVRELRDRGDGIYFDEVAMNDLGYELLGQERFPEAIEVLRLNVEVFPLSANAFDSLAEACMRSGDSANAAAYYRRSLELDPGNTNAIEKLKVLEGE